MKKPRYLMHDTLQLVMSAILIGLGILLKSNAPISTAAVLFLAIPGMTLLCGFFMNKIDYRHFITFPLILLLIMGIQDLLLYYTHPFPISFKFGILMAVVIGVTVTMGTLYHMLHGELIKYEDLAK